MSTPLIHLIQVTMRRLTGRVYPELDLSPLNERSLQALLRFVRDAEGESQMRARRAQLYPWRRP